MSNNILQYVEVSLSTGQKRLFHEGNLRLRLQAIGAHRDDIKALFAEGKAFCLPGACFRLRDEALDNVPNMQAALSNGTWGFDR